MNIDRININDVMYHAIEEKNETLMREVVLKAITFFLENTEYDQEDLYTLAISYVSVPIELKWKNDFNFKDRKLRYVLEELTAIEEKDSKRAKEIVRRCKLYLEDKDYENIK